jgi:salicylate biosynthesis isochorismate synthase
VVVPREASPLADAQPSRSDRADRRFIGIRLPGAFDPRTLLADPRRNHVVASYERPAHGLALVGVGDAGRAEMAPGGSPEDVRDAARALLDAPVEADETALRPRLLGGFAFDGRKPASEPWAEFAPGALVLPRMLFVREGNVSGVVIAPGVDPGELEAVLGGSHGDDCANRTLRIARDLDRDRWLASVGAIAAAVRAGRYEKAVLAAARELEADGHIGVGAALARLRDQYPYCHVFSLRAGDGVFLGASPELLVSLRNGVVRALGLAGSMRRDADADTDARLGQALMDSAKDRIEHETVVRALRESLAPLTQDLRAPNQPGLLKLRNIQHLATEVTGRAAEGVDVLTLLQHLHPTPAVCGYPTAAARAVIDAHETFERGWYAGPIGWLDAACDGEFAVALRSALVRGSRAWLFAGAGIMGDSRPADELAEIEMKFTPLTGALAGGAEL